MPGMNTTWKDTVCQLIIPVEYQHREISVSNILLPNFFVATAV